MRTLWGYHGLGCDLARTAAALGKHRSTVRYRLYRVRELTGLEPEDPRAVEALLDVVVTAAGPWCGARCRCRDGSRRVGARRRRRGHAPPQGRW
ncbi:helix-turn-helix domain-containing protein [Pseudonocardia sp. H11422]|uniref:helix-turn-helix domain-containing protein n=1 Tax=Pseudonocardia sp. H11422 TaxID=2835866 RepID=UPI0039774F7A